MSRNDPPWKGPTPEEPPTSSSDRPVASGSIDSILGPSWKQSTGQTSTQSVYLHLMQFSVTTNVMGVLS